MLRNIAVITGGYSAENIVSYESSDTVMNALDREKYNPFLICIERDRWYLKQDNGTTTDIDKNDFSVTVDGKHILFDMAFISLHGTPAEDGLLTAYFELIGLPYSSCNTLAAQTTFDKGTTISLAKSYGFTTATSVELQSDELKDAYELCKDLTFPVFVKPCHAGSSFGISRVKETGKLEDALKLAFEHSKTCLVEEEIIGTEVTCGVYSESGTVKTLPITEVVAHNDFFDFEAKYHGKADEITPARISKEHEMLIRKTSIKAYKDFRLKGICRIDYILSNDKAFLIEINTVPGLTKESFVPQQVRAAGIELKDFFSTLIENEL